MTPNEIFEKYPRASTPEAIAAARKWLETGFSRDVYATANYAGFDVKGDSVGIKIQGPCHGSLCSTIKNRSAVVATYTSTMKQRKDTYSPFAGLNSRPEYEDLCKRWFEFLVNESYWSPFYVATTPEQARSSGFIVEGNLPINIILGACIVSRHLHENPSLVVWWYELVKKGADPNFAYAFVWGNGVFNANAFSSAQNPMTSKEFLKAPAALQWGVGHNSISLFNEYMLEGIMTKRYCNLLESPFGDPNPNGARTYGLSSIIPYKEGQSASAYAHKASKTLKRILDALDLEGVSQSFVANPFMKAATLNTMNYHASKTMVLGYKKHPSNEELLEGILKIEKEFVK